MLMKFTPELLSEVQKHIFVTNGTLNCVTSVMFDLKFIFTNILRTTFAPISFCQKSQTQTVSTYKLLLKR